ncbi:MAG: hypothetical protein M1836_007964 [Candelina mexicana]|nr:MAG: hypothetical protein M1836_007964 [Candelina mexicana]
MPLDSKLHSYLETDLSQHKIGYGPRTELNLTSSPTPPSSPASSVTILQDRSNSDRRPNLRVYEAKRILQSCDVRNIELLCRFRPYEDESLPARILQCHREHRLDVILKCLDIQANNWDRDKKVEVILERVMLKPTYSTLKWMWPDFREMEEMDPQRIAGIFDKRSLYHFQRVPFEDWVRLALNHSPASVAEFLDQMPTIRDQLAKHLRQSPEAFEKYAQVERALHERNPFAHWIVSTRFQPAPERFAESDRPHHTLDFIVQPLQQLLQDQTRQLTDILEQLAVLAVRFKHSYVDAVEIDWMQQFRTEVTFFEHLRHMSSMQLANLMTNSDVELFRKLRPQDIIDHAKGINNNQVKELGMRWNRLCEVVQECVIANSQLVHSISKVAEV